MKLGKFTIDPKTTDFVGMFSIILFTNLKILKKQTKLFISFVFFFTVIPRIASPKLGVDENRLIPQWAIAVIVVGVGGLLFIIVFGVSVVSITYLFCFFKSFST